MYFNRRRFLTQGGLMLGLGGACAATNAPSRSRADLAGEPLTAYERIFAETTHLAALGVPRCWESVRRGFHPFSPDRVAMLPANDWPKADVVAHRARQVRELLQARPPDVPESFWSSDSFRLYIEVSETLSAYYRGVPAEDWLRALAAGEQFYGFMPFGQVKWLLSLHFAPARTPRVVNPPVDWWLFLLRDPPAVETFAGVQRPRLAVGHVYAGPRESMNFYCDVGFLCQEWLRWLDEDSRSLNRICGVGVPPACGVGVPPAADSTTGFDFVAEVAAMDRVDAARWMNLEMAFVLERLNQEKR